MRDGGLDDPRRKRTRRPDERSPVRRYEGPSTSKSNHAQPEEENHTPTGVDEDEDEAEQAFSGNAGRVAVSERSERAENGRSRR